MKTIKVKVYGTGTTVDSAVSDEDYEYVSRFNWRLVGRGYVARQISHYENGKRRYGCVYLHREITGASSGEVVDHINRNPLDNRRCNLRLCTQSQNLRNSGGYKTIARNGRMRVSQYKGVGRADSKKNPWSARITVDGEDRRLGVFPTELDAARAYDAAAREIFGEFARLNEIDKAA
jgi:hypothetical protein